MSSFRIRSGSDEGRVSIAQMSTPVLPPSTEDEWRDDDEDQCQVSMSGGFITKVAMPPYFNVTAVTVFFF